MQLPQALVALSALRHRPFCLALALLLALVRIGLAQPPAVADAEAGTEPDAAADKADAIGSDWVRVLLDDDGNVVGLQTAVVRYAPKAGAASSVLVDLIGAVHVGDRAYYQKLNERFRNYDALLYELVAPEGTVVEQGRGTSNTHPVGALQNGMKQMLELEHQLELVDYTPENFVHADMTPKQFAQSMTNRGEGFMQMYFRLMGQAIAHQSRMSAKGESVDFDLLSALFARDRARQLKIAMAKQMADVESLLVGFGGEQGSTLITERNKTALEVLRQQLAAGKRRLGVFYGAGHLADMHDRLEQDFDLRPVGITWLTAWDMSTGD